MADRRNTIHFDFGPPDREQSDKQRCAIGRIAILDELPFCFLYRPGWLAGLNVPVDCAGALVINRRIDGACPFRHLRYNPFFGIPTVFRGRFLPPVVDRRGDFYSRVSRRSP